jgi:hypothetical protein
MDADILGYWELHIMFKGYNMDADILGRQEPYIISKSYIDSKKGLISMVESTQNDVQLRAKGNAATLKNKQLEPITLAGEEVGTKISKNNRVEPTALIGEEVGIKTLRQEGEGTKLSYIRR